MMVDPDTANGTLNRCLHTLDLYRQCKELVTGKTPLFGAEISNNPQPYTPVDPSTNTLKAMFKTDYHAESDDERKRGETMLIRSLFSNEEIGQPLEQGFRGRPAIGAVTFGRSVVFTSTAAAAVASKGVDGKTPSDLPKSNVWHDFADKVRERAQSSTVRILFVGSIFGGSGASGIPTLVRLVHDEFAGEFGDRLQLGLILYQPYFDFKEVNVEQGTIAASSKDFALASAEALQYYSDSGYFKFCRSIYTLGEQARTYIPHGGQSEGGLEQRNDPHYLELVGALGAVEFFRGARSKDKLFLAARATNDGMGWADLPQPNMQPAENTPAIEKEQIRVEPREMFEDKLKRMTRFAIAYHYYVYSQICTKPGVRGDWDVYTASIRPNRESEALRQLSIVDQYCDLYLKWLISILRPHGAGFNLHLFQIDQIGHEVQDSWRTWTPEEYQRGGHADRLPKLVIQAEGSPEGPDVTRIRTGASARMRSLEPEPVEAGRLVRLVYDAC
jgi:hypothetical protein